MGWVWRDEEGDDQNNNMNPNFRNPNSSSSSSEICGTRKVVRSNCKTERVESGKFIRKCEKTETILKDCIGKPVEVVQSNTEYTEDDVTDEMTQESARGFDSVPFDFPGLRGDIESIERHLFGGMNRFFEAAEDVKNGFFSAVFDAFGRHGEFSSSLPSVKGGVYGGEASRSPSMGREVPIEEASPKPKTEGPQIDLSDLMKDV